MKNAIKIALASSLFLAATSAFATPPKKPAFAKPITPPTYFNAVLTGVTPGFLGNGYVTSIAYGQKGGFEATVNLPVDGTTILDSNTAVQNVYTLNVNAGSSVVASCTLNIADIHFRPNGIGTPPTEIAEYRVAIHEDGTIASAHIGNCTDTNGNTVLPVIAAADTVTITAPNSTSPLLTGIFNQTQPHRK